MREILQLGLSAAQLAAGGRKGGAGRLAAGAAGAFMLGDALYSVYGSQDRGTGMQVMRVLRGALGAVLLVSAVVRRG